MDVVCVSETWPIPHRVFGYCDSEIRNWDRYECWNEEGSNNSPSLSLLILHEEKEEGRKEKKRKVKEETEKRDMANFRLVENCPGEERLRAGEGVVFPKNVRRKARNYIWRMGVDDGVRGDRLEAKLSFFFDS